MTEPSNQAQSTSPVIDEGVRLDRLTLLGPQRRPTVGAVLPDLPGEVPLATVTAGWQEREPDDRELDQLLEGRSANLSLFGRWLDVTERDPEFAAAAANHRALLSDLRQLHLVRLEAAIAVLQNIRGRSGDSPAAIEAAIADAEDAIRLIDDRQAQRIHDADIEFEAAFAPLEREVLREHIEGVHRVLEQACALFIAGGHVGVLLRLLKMFKVAERVPSAVVAWSAGAMTLTERVVLFHDRTPQGASPVEIYDKGLGLLHNVVLLPDGRRRLLVEDRARMAELVRRLSPAVCVVLDRGTRLDFEAAAAVAGSLPPHASTVGVDGRISNGGQT